MHYVILLIKHWNNLYILAMQHFFSWQLESKIPQLSEVDWGTGPLLTMYVGAFTALPSNMVYIMRLAIPL
jgi:hypothetical protein